MYCNKCGKFIENERYCPRCGARQPAGQPMRQPAGQSMCQPAGQSMRQPVRQPVGQNFKRGSEQNRGYQSVRTPMPKTVKKKKGHKGLIAVSCLTAAILIFFLAHLMMGKRTQPNISYDSDNLPYYNDTVIVYGYDDFQEAQCLELAESIGGRVEEFDPGSQAFFKIKVPKTDIEQLKYYAQLLMDKEEVLFASYDYPIEYEPTTYSNTWRAHGEGTEEDLHNTENPEGHDWWAEAVDAYTVWDNYTDLIEEPVNIGIIDTGFAPNHEELSGKITVVGGKAYDDHGTEVSGLIVANNNDVGIRGIADRSHLYAFSEDVTGTKFSSMNNYIADLVTERQARIINCSFGHHYLKIDSNVVKYQWQANVLNWLWSTSSYITEDDRIIYQTEYQYKRLNECTRDAKFALTTMYILHKRGFDDYIIIQAAGNGENNEGPGVDAMYSGWVCSITEPIYDSWLAENPKFEDLGFDYYKSHTMVVSSVTNDRYENGNYKMDYGANFGTNVDICAPGDKIFTIYGEKESKYKEASGTSLAAPIVTGAAAVVWSLNPELSAGEVKEILISTSQYDVIDEDGPDSPAYPMLNVGEAAKKAYEQVDPTYVPSSPTIDANDEVDNSTQVSETDSEQSKTDVESDSYFTEYLQDSLVPQYSVMPTYLLDSENLSHYAGWDASELNGILSATIKDFDSDGYDELLTVRFTTTPDGDTDLILEMYEYAANTQAISLCAEVRMDTTNGYSGSSILGYRQIGIFSYEYNGSTYIAVDTSLIANESISTLAVFTYIGVNSEYTQPGGNAPDFGTGTPTQFAYYGGAGFQQQGSGLWTVWEGVPTWEGRSTIQPQNPLFCASWADEWHELCSYDGDSTGIMISREQAQEFMRSYRSKVESMGLSTDDVRLATEDNMLTQDQYKSEHTTTPQIYKAIQGNIDFISGIYTYSSSFPAEPRELLREDYQHTLDAYR